MLPSLSDGSDGGGGSRDGGDVGGGGDLGVSQNIERSRGRVHGSGDRHRVGLSHGGRGTDRRCRAGGHGHGHRGGGRRDRGGGGRHAGARARGGVLAHGRAGRGGVPGDDGGLGLALLDVNGGEGPGGCRGRRGGDGDGREGSDQASLDRCCGDSDGGVVSLCRHSCGLGHGQELRLDLRGVILLGRADGLIHGAASSSSGCQLHSDRWPNSVLQVQMGSLTAHWA
ncbi:hypothetical protein PG994_004032 [Apiospora phragmitis]|uniref:Uncharacterized protein n=1 Tax=Apiospora phragmitis TaxID=2905665 RepID=A0ABR1W2R5_9PEZI